MHVILVHHADALGPGVDPQRPLSSVGLKQASWLAEEAKTAGVFPAVIWHSGKLRARQTAEAFLRLNPMAPFKMIRGLLPDDPPEMLRETLAHETADVMLVGHWPHMPALLQLLTRSSASFPLHGLVILELVGDGYAEVRRISPRVES